MSGVKWHLVVASVVFDEEGFVTSGVKVVYELVYQQLRDHGIFKNWDRFERISGEATIGKCWRSGDTSVFRSIKKCV